MRWAVEGMAKDCYKTIFSQRTSSLTRSALQTVNILLHWISASKATVQASLVFTPYLTHKKQQERPGLNESSNVPHFTGLV